MKITVMSCECMAQGKDRTNSCLWWILNFSYTWFKTLREIRLYQANGAFVIFWWWRKTKRTKVHRSPRVNLVVAKNSTCMAMTISNSQNEQDCVISGKIICKWTIMTGWPDDSKLTILRTNKSFSLPLQFLPPSKKNIAHHSTTQHNLPHTPYLTLLYLLHKNNHGYLLSRPTLARLFPGMPAMHSHCRRFREIHL